MDYIYAIRDNFRKRFDEIAEAQNDLFVCSNLEKAKIDDLARKIAQINFKISRLIQNEQIPKLLDDELAILSTNLHKIYANFPEKKDENLKIPPNLDFSLKNSDATFVVPSKFETKNCDSDEKEENLRPKFVENKQKLQIEYLNEEEFKNIPSYMKGRLNLSEINRLIDKFNQCLLEKYDFLSKKVENCRVSKEKFNYYKRQLCPQLKNNEGFLIENDLKSFISTPKDQKIFFKSVVQILRHFKRIREHRSSGFCRFVIMQ